ncbi:MAG TPA: hypothetical protein VK609_19535 [Mucilaginibacter sp.]|nr:hypothetical protein [Mucilaginibacter sp.]
MKHFYKLLLPALLLPFFSYAQSNYKPGYVVTAKGDSLKGSIDLREWENNPHNIYFKSQTGVKNYTAKEIRAFGTSNVTYDQYMGLISTDETNVSRLSTGRDTSYKQDTTFLKVIQKGANVTLYSYVDNLKPRYFIAENQNGRPYELVYRIYHTPDRGVETHSENVFVSQLYELALKYNPASDELRLNIEKSQYNGPELKKITEKINKMTADTRDYGTGSAIEFFAGAGVSINAMKLTGTFPFYNAPNNNAVWPTLSIGANIYTNSNVKQFAFRVEVLFTKSAYKSMVDVYYNQPEKPKSDYHFDQYIAAFYPQVLYNIYNTNKLKFYLDMGLAFNLSKNTGNTFRNNFNGESSTNYLSLNTYWITYPVKVGFVLNKKFDISVSYAFKTSLTDNMNHEAKVINNYSIDLTSIRAGINYNF